MALAERKARAVATRLEAGIVLGADTIVVLDGKLLGKPADDADATRMLRRLSGREHRVVTGIAVVDAGTGALRTSAVISVVRFRTLTMARSLDMSPPANPRERLAPTQSKGLEPDLISDSGRLLHQRRRFAALRDGATVTRGGR